MQILRINKIKNYRIYQDWGMAHDECFEKFNVIYGSNGSGKSTLASLLSTLADGDWSSGTILKVRDEDTQQDRNISDTDSTLTNSLCVFNEDYILKNLRFDKGETESLLYLGRESIDNQKRREELEEAINTANRSTIPQFEKQLRDAEKKLESLGRNGAKDVVQKLQHIDDRYNGRRYNRKHFLEALDKDSKNSGKCDPSDEDEQNESSNNSILDINQKIKNIAHPAEDKINEILALRIPLNDINSQVSSILAQTVTSEAIEALKNNHAAATWVQKGMQIHNAGDQCLFCEGVYTAERVSRLNRHFDESMIQIQQNIDTLDTQISKYEEQCEQFATFLHPPRSLNNERTKSWLDQVDTVRRNVTAVKEYLISLHNELARKQKKLFQPLDFNDASIEDTLSGDVDTEAINEIIREHNRDIDNYEELKNQVCSDVVEYYVEQVRKNYEASKKAVQEAEKKLKSTKDGLEKNKAELQILQNSQQDRTHFAKLLTTDLHHYFGRDELTLELTGEAYSILRNGETAKHLSEGERRSIALLYFLRDIDSNGAKLSKRIVVIDDPVSSIDDNSALSAFTYIYKKCITTFDIQNTKNKDKNIGQLFILTHNFDFFRRWVNIFIKDNNIRKCTTIRELRVNNVTTSSNIAFRTPRFIDWSMAKKYSLLRSEYHYLFWRAATELMCWKYSSSSNVTDYYDIAIIPNVCRRLLEGFLSFHYPQDVGNFTKQMEHVVDQLSNSTTRTYMVNFLHNYSHNEQCDLTKPIDIYESSKVIEHVFNTIYLLDENHYKAMCEAFDIEESKLLPSWRKIS